MGAKQTWKSRLKPVSKKERQGVRWEKQEGGGERAGKKNPRRRKRWGGGVEEGADTLTD